MYKNRPGISGMHRTPTTDSIHTIIPDESEKIFFVLLQNMAKRAARILSRLVFRNEESIWLPFQTVFHFLDGWIRIIDF